MSAVLGVLWALGVLVLAALGLALVALALPLHVRVRGAVHDGEPSGAVRVAWAFGLVSAALGGRGLEVRVAGARVFRRRLRALFRRDRGREAKAQDRERREERRREARARGAKRDRSRLASFLDHRATLLRMLRRLGRTLHLRLRLRGTVGLDDPADTAKLAEVLGALAALPGADAEVEVDWLEETLELEAVGSARIWVPETAAVVLGLWLARENRAAVRAVASGT